MGRRLLAAFAAMFLVPILVSATRAPHTTYKIDTTVVRQVTTDLTLVDEYRGGMPVISGDGTKIAFQAQATSTSNYVIDEMDFSGASRTQLDTWQFSGAPWAMIEIEDLGIRVIASDQYQLRLASSGQQLVRVSGQEISQIAISGDGSLIFFLVRRDTTTVPGGQTLQRGLYTIKPDGTCLTQVASPATVGAALGLTAANVFPFDSDYGTTLDANRNGTQAVFGVTGSGQGYLLSWTGAACSAGSVTKVLGPPTGPGFPKIWHAAIDPVPIIEGIAYDIGDSTRVLGFIGADGGSNETIHSGPALLAPEDRLTISDEGQLLAGYSGALFDIGAGAPDHVVGQLGPGYGLNTDAAGDRFVYVVRDGNNHYQIWSIDRDPGHTGVPRITEPSIVPDFVHVNGDAARLRVRVKFSGKLHVSYEALFANGPNFGLPDTFVTSGPLHKVKGTVSTYQAMISAFSQATPGPRIIRIEATGTQDGKTLTEHADITPFRVRK